MTDIYIITECFQDYKGASTTPWGAYKSLESAKKGMRDSIRERFGDYIFDDMTDEEAEAWINEKFYDWNYWEYDDGDTVTKFYIDEIALED